MRFFFLKSLQNLQLSVKSQASWKHNRPLVQAKINTINIYRHKALAKYLKGGVLKASSIG